MTRKNLLFALIVLTGLAAHSQVLSSISAQKVPTKVLSTFQSQFPGATSVTWEEQMEIYYLPKFTMAGTEKKALIDAKGNFQEVLTKIASSALPATTTTYLNANYGGKLINYAAQITYANNTPVHYEVLVGGKDLIFDTNGAFMNVSNNVFK